MAEPVLAENRPDEPSVDFSKHMGQLASKLHRALPSREKAAFYEAPHGIALRPEIADATKESLSNPMYARLFPEGDAVNSETLDRILSEPDIDQVQVLRAVEAFKILQPAETTLSWIGRLSGWSYDTRAATQIDNVEKAMQKNLSVDKRVIDELIVRVNVADIARSIEENAEHILDNHLNELNPQTFIFLLRALRGSATGWLSDEAHFEERMTYVLERLSTKEREEVNTLSDYSGDIWFHHAAKKGIAIPIEDFVAKHGEEEFFKLCKSTNKQNQTWLHLAALEGHGDLLQRAMQQLSVEHILELGQIKDRVRGKSYIGYGGRVQINYSDRDFLSYAANNNLEDPVATIISRLSQEQVDSIDGHEPLEELFISAEILASNGHFTPLNLLIDRLSEESLFRLARSYDGNLLQLAAKHGAWETIHQIVSKLSSEHLQEATKVEDFENNNWLDIAAGEGHGELLAKLVDTLPLEQLESLTKIKGNQKENWIHVAARGGLWEPIEKIIAKYGTAKLLELSERIGSGGSNEPYSSILHAAAQGGHREFIDRLLENLTDEQLLALTQITEPKRWLSAAIANGHMEIFDNFVARFGLDKAMTSRGSSTTIFEDLLIRKETAHLVVDFLDRFSKADIIRFTEITRGKWLSYAARHGQWEVVEKAITLIGTDEFVRLGLMAEDSMLAEAVSKKQLVFYDKLCSLLTQDQLYNLSRQKERSGHTLMHFLAMGNHRRAFEILVGKLTEEQVTHLITQQNGEGATCCHLALRLHNPLFVNDALRLLSEEQILAMSLLQNNEGATWIHSAANKEMFAPISILARKVGAAAFRELSSILDNAGKAWFEHLTTDFGEPGMYPLVLECFQNQLHRPADVVLGEQGFPVPDKENLAMAVASIISETSEAVEDKFNKFIRGFALHLFRQSSAQEIDSYFKTLSIDQISRLMHAMRDEVEGETKEQRDLNFIFSAMGEHSPKRDDILRLLSERGGRDGGIKHYSMLRYATLLQHIVDSLPEEAPERAAYVATVGRLKTSIAFSAARVNEAVILHSQDHAELMTKLIPQTRWRVVFSIANAGSGVSEHEKTAEDRYVTYREFKIDVRFLKELELWNFIFMSPPKAKDIYDEFVKYERRSGDAEIVYANQEEIVSFGSERHAMAMHFLPGEMPLPDNEDLSSRDQTTGSCHIRSVNEAVRRSLFLALGREGYKKFRERLKKQIQVDYADLLAEEPLVSAMVDEGARRAALRAQAASRQKDDGAFAASVEAVYTYIRASEANREQFTNYLSGQRTEEEMKAVAGTYPDSVEGLLKWMMDAVRTPRERQNICMFHLEHVDPVLADA